MQLFFLYEYFHFSDFFPPIEYDIREKKLIDEDEFANSFGQKLQDFYEREILSLLEHW